MDCHEMMRMNSAIMSAILLLFLIFSVFPCPSSSSSAKEKCHPEDKKALLNIKKALNNPYMLASWDPTSDCCRWYSVKCHLTTHRISELFITKGNLPGQIPAAIADLPHLELLVLHKLPDLSGPIPSSISKLHRLSHLDLSYINLTGTIPDFLGHLKSLTLLDLSFNKLTGKIPASLSLNPSLSWIDLSRNKLTGTIPESLSNLQAVKLALILSHNQLFGPIPASLGKIDFSLIDFSRNKLEGDFSMLFGESKTTEIVHLSRNMFEFDMSNMQVQSKLRYLDIDHNRIYGRIPEGFVKLDLQAFNVSYNRLCGKIPKGGNLQEFDYSTFFHNKCLCGSPLGIKCKKLLA